MRCRMPRRSGVDGAYRLKGVRGERFEATLNVNRAAGQSASGVFFSFGGGAMELRNFASSKAPIGHGAPVNVTANASAVPSVAAGSPLWFRVSSDGVRVTVRAATSEAGLATAAACWSGDYDVRGDAFQLSPHYYGVATIDDFTLRMDRDANGSYETTEVVERFTLDATGHAGDTLEYDAAGNLTYDGTFHYTYDAWNRQVTVTKAYRDDNGVIQLGSVIQENEYDGLGRRIVVKVQNSGDLDNTEHVYYDGWSQVETRNGSDIVTKQMVWAGRVGGYIDELLQIAHNLDWPDALPAADQTCETKFWAMQDANYNVLGVVDDAGVLVERYEYTPYGERTVFASPSMVLSNGQVSNCKHNSIGFQGHAHGEVTGSIESRMRILDPFLGRFLTPDPLGYVDGPSSYLFMRGAPSSGIDPLGLKSEQDYRQTLSDSISSWYGRGDNFAARVLVTFLSRKGKVNPADTYHFDGYGHLIEANKIYRAYAMHHFGRIVAAHVRARSFAGLQLGDTRQVQLPDSPIEVDAQGYVQKFAFKFRFKDHDDDLPRYFQNKSKALYGDDSNLFNAIGGARVGYTNATLSLSCPTERSFHVDHLSMPGKRYTACFCTFTVTADMSLRDTYTFPSRGAALVYGDYGAARSLEQEYGYMRFVTAVDWKGEYSFTHLGGGFAEEEQEG